MGMILPLLVLLLVHDAALMLSNVFPWHDGFVLLDDAGLLTLGLKNDDMDFILMLGHGRSPGGRSSCKDNVLTYSYTLPVYQVQELP